MTTIPPETDQKIIAEIMRRGVIVLISIFFYFIFMNQGISATFYENRQEQSARYSDFMEKEIGNIAEMNSKKVLRKACVTNGKFIQLRVFVISIDDREIVAKPVEIQCPVFMNDRDLRKMNIIDYFIFDEIFFRDIALISSHGSFFQEKIKNRTEECLTVIKSKNEDILFANIYDFFSFDKAVLSGCFM